MLTPLEWLVATGLTTIGELAAFSDVARTTISRQLSGSTGNPKRRGWRDEGLVASLMEGRLLRPAERLLATSKLLGQVFPGRHPHPGPRDGHEHDPRYPDRWGHRHPSFFNGKEGVLYLYERLELAEVFYPLAPTLFQGDGAKWSPSGEPLKITSWRWLRYGRLVEAVATYEEGVTIFFCWVGQEVTGPMLRWRYANMFERAKTQHLVTVSSGEIMEEERDPRFGPLLLGPDLDPHPSGFVIAGPDERALKTAERILPRTNFVRVNAVAYITAKGTRLYKGRAEPVPDNVYDRFESIEVGFPEDLCRRTN